MQVDAVAVVSCSSEAQRQRVLLRAGMEPGILELRIVLQDKIVWTHAPDGSLWNTMPCKAEMITLIVCMCSKV